MGKRKPVYTAKHPRKPPTSTSTINLWVETKEALDRWDAEVGGRSKAEMVGQAVRFVDRLDPFLRGQILSGISMDALFEAARKGILRLDVFEPEPKQDS